MKDDVTNQPATPVSGAFQQQRQRRAAPRYHPSFSAKFLKAVRTPDERARRIVAVDADSPELSGEHSLFLPSKHTPENDELIALVKDCGWPQRRVLVTLHWEKTPPSRKNTYITRCTVFAGGRRKRRKAGYYKEQLQLQTLQPPTQSTLDWMKEHWAEILALLTALVPVITLAVTALQTPKREPQKDSEGADVPNEAYAVTEEELNALVDKRLKALLPAILQEHKAQILTEIAAGAPLHELHVDLSTCRQVHKSINLQVDKQTNR